MSPRKKIQPLPAVTPQERALLDELISHTLDYAEHRDQIVADLVRIDAKHASLREDRDGSWCDLGHWHAEPG